MVSTMASTSLITILAVLFISFQLVLCVDPLVIEYEGGSSTVGYFSQNNSVHIRAYYPNGTQGEEAVDLQLLRLGEIRPNGSEVFSANFADLDSVTSKVTEVLSDNVRQSIRNKWYMNNTEVVLQLSSFENNGTIRVGSEIVEVFSDMMKVTYSFSNYPFESVNNSFFIEVRFDIQGPMQGGIPIFDVLIDTEWERFVQVETVNGIISYRYFRWGLRDGMKVKIESDEDDTVDLGRRRYSSDWTYTMPSWQLSFLYDPDFSIVLPGAIGDGGSSSPKGKNPSPVEFTAPPAKEGDSWSSETIIMASVFAAIGVLVVVGIIGFFAGKKRLAKRQRKFRKRQIERSKELVHEGELEVEMEEEC